MFGKNTNDNKDFSGILTNKCKFTGNLEFTGIFRIDCDFIGDILKGDQLEIAPSGRMNGNATVESATIGGYFKGTMRVKQALQLHKTAVVEGEIFMESNSLETEPGARVEGTIHMPKAGESGAKSAAPSFGAQPIKAK